MILLQLSSAQGPAECELAVALAARRVLQEAAPLSVTVDVLEQVDGAVENAMASVLFALDGDNAMVLAERWVGSLLWVCKSPLRPQHQRKNWFFGGQVFDALTPCADSDIRFETMRAGGAGGQHVNKTDSAIRATHIASGIVVKVQSERSQHANKKLARLLIAKRLQDRREQSLADERQTRWSAHYAVERGNAVRRFVGLAFESM